MTTFNGLGRNLGNLSWLSEADTRSISAENPTGAKGAGAMAEPEPNGPARELGRGWKCRPYVTVEPGTTAVLAEIEGSGAIQSMWFGGSIMDRDFILRIYWEGQEQPAVECPLTDFFAMPFSFQNPDRPNAGPITQISSLPVAVNPNRGLNCFWEMPFRRRARITLENRNPLRAGACFYQVNYCLTEVPAQAAHFHAQFRRSNPLPYLEPYVILDGVRGAVTMWAPRWAGISTTAAGGAKVRSSSSSMAMGNTRPSVALAPKTILAAPTTLTSMGRTRPIRRLFWACIRCSSPMAPTGRSIAMRCIAGM